MIYKERLKNLREEKDLKLRDIDKILDLQLDTYGKFESEKTIIPILRLNSLCNYFGVSIDYVFGFSDVRDHVSSKKNIDLSISGQRLREFRKENKLTQENLANVLKTLRQTLSNYEAGKQVIATPFLYDICKKYKISADYLLGKIDSPKHLDN